MAVLLDPSAVLAAADAADLNHRAAVSWFERVDEPLLLGALYTAPNYFGESPALQVTTGKTTVQINSGTAINSTSNGMRTICSPLSRPG